MGALKSLNPYLLKYKWSILIGITCVILSNIFAIYIPVYVRQAIDDVVAITQILPNSQGNILYKNILFNALGFGAMVFIAAIFKGIFLYLMRQTLIVASRNIEFDQKNELYSKYQELDETFYRKNYTGDLMSRISEDISNVRMYIGPSIMYFANILFSFILIIGQMATINWHLTLWVLIPLPFLSYSIYKVSSLINIGNKQIQEQLSIITTKAQESFAGIRIIKSFGAEFEFASDFKSTGIEYKKKSLKLAKINALFFPLMTLLMGVSTIIVLYIGGLEVQKGKFTAGNVAEFIIYLNMLIWPVASLGWTTALVQKASASQQRIQEFLKIPVLKNLQNLVFKFNDVVSISNLSYQYADKNDFAIRNLEFEIKKGQFIGLVGKTGSGKSTFLQILARQLNIHEGSYKLDGIDIGNIDLVDFRDNIAYVQQDVFLLSDTIKENILFGSKSVPTNEMLNQILDVTQLTNDLKNFPDGINTVIGERGVSLSGGQKQRVSLARALMKKSEILILDDCLSAVDADTEERILSKLKIIMKSKTVIMASHRITPLILADTILVLENGELTNSGNHDYLLESNDFYAWLNENQNNFHSNTV